VLLVHTRQIDVGGTSYRIDGGPAITDFQSFFADLDIAVSRVLNDDAVFNQFAIDVLGGMPTQPAKKKLRAELAAWQLPNHAIVKGSLPVDSPWGPARLDAVSEIFNRVSGLDIGPQPPYIIPENIKLADVPVRYPFLWNAWRQDFTQWPGFSANGNQILGLARNVGEVIGVFAEFHPVKDRWRLLGINYVRHNSSNFPGLNKLEDLISKLGPPKWPWALHQGLVAKGALVYKQKDAAHGNQSCEDCHGIRKGEFRTPFHETWATPILDVGTDSREVNLLSSQVKTGVLKGASFPGSTPLKEVDSAISVLALSVGGSILQHYFSLGLAEKDVGEARRRKQLGGIFKSEVGEDLGDVGSPSDLKDAWRPRALAATGPFPYESRVLEGIWAAAPYLHNGSVPTLTELLTPDTQRLSEFMVGPAYDIEKVGLAAQQTKFNFTLKTTDCAARNSGNSRCGHDFGTSFSAEDKKALLEYLKSL